MYESSGSQFFVTNTGIQSGPDDFDESRLESLGTFSAYNFTLSNAEDNTISNLRFENTISNLPEVTQAKCLGSDSLFISANRFGSSKNPFATISSVSEINFR